MNVGELIGSLRALDVHADKVSLLNTHSKIIKDALWRDLKSTGATKLLIELALEVDVNPDHVRSVEIRFRATDRRFLIDSFGTQCGREQIDLQAFMLDYVRAHVSAIHTDRVAKGCVWNGAYKLFEQSFRILRYLSKAKHTRQEAEVRIKTIFVIQIVLSWEKYPVADDL